VSETSQRLDEWLFVSRMFKSKHLAKEMIARGKIRVNSMKVTGAAASVKIGDILTFPKADEVIILEVKGIFHQRQAFEQAKNLYERLDKPIAPHYTEQNESEK
jgi:ribosome-associated heat shock protein Hsp15